MRGNKIHLPQWEAGDMKGRDRRFPSRSEVKKIRISWKQRLQKLRVSVSPAFHSENRNSPEERQQPYDEPDPTSTKGSMGIPTATGAPKNKKTSHVYKVTKTSLLVVGYKM